jgi:hypothetical protein
VEAFEGSGFNVEYWERVQETLDSLSVSATSGNINTTGLQGWFFFGFFAAVISTILIF